MKQKFILSFVAITFGVLIAAAQDEEKLVVNAGPAEHIRIAADMNVVLMQAKEADKSMSMDIDAFEKLNLQLSKNSLTISSANESIKERPTVFLYVNNLKTLTVESNSTVNTAGVLNARQVDVFVEGATRVHLKTKGEVKAHGLDNREIKVKYLTENWLARLDSFKQVSKNQ